MWVRERRAVPAPHCPSLGARGLWWEAAGCHRAAGSLPISSRRYCGWDAGARGESCCSVPLCRVRLQLLPGTCCHPCYGVRAPAAELGRGGDVQGGWPRPR